MRLFIYLNKKKNSIPSTSSQLFVDSAILFIGLGYLLKTSEVDGWRKTSNGTREIIINIRYCVYTVYTGAMNYDVEGSNGCQPDTGVRRRKVTTIVVRGKKGPVGHRNTVPYSFAVHSSRYRSFFQPAVMSLVVTGSSSFAYRVARKLSLAGGIDIVRSAVRQNNDLARWKRCERT